MRRGIPGAIPIVTRRTFIASGAALLAAAARPACATVAPPTPRIDPRLKLRALLALASRRSVIPNGDYIGITDFARPSRDPRFYLLDVHSGMVTQHLVAHGRGSDPLHSGWLERFSNEIGSEATSAGAYLTHDIYYGKYGRSLRLQGLDASNSNADARAIVLHSAWYAEPEVVRDHGKLGRSEGCFALPMISHAEILTRLGPGRLLYADKI